MGEHSDSLFPFRACTHVVLGFHVSTIPFYSVYPTSMLPPLLRGSPLSFWIPSYQHRARGARAVGMFPEICRAALDTRMVYSTRPSVPPDSIFLGVQYSHQPADVTPPSTVTFCPYLDNLQSFRLNSFCNTFSVLSLNCVQNMRLQNLSSLSESCCKHVGSSIHLLLPKMHPLSVDISSRTHPDLHPLRLSLV